MLPLLRCFFAHLLILQYPDHHQNLISSYLYYSGPVHKISSQSVHNFLSNVVHRQTNRQTNATKNITSFAKEVISCIGITVTQYNVSLTMNYSTIGLHNVLQRTLGIIRRDLDIARQENFHLGLKCVRGAYIMEVCV